MDNIFGSIILKASLKGKHFKFSITSRFLVLSKLFHRIHFLKQVDWPRMNNVLNGQNLKAFYNNIMYWTLVAYVRIINACVYIAPPSVVIYSQQNHTKLTLSCSKQHSIFSSRKALLADVIFLKILGIFFKATRLPVRGSVTDLCAMQQHFSATVLRKCFGLFYER